MAAKNSLLKKKDEEFFAKQIEIEGLSRTLEERNRWQNLQDRYKELELANTREIMKDFEALEQAKKDKEFSLGSAAAEAKVERIRCAKEILTACMNNPEYVSKVGRECASYLNIFVNTCKDKVSRLVDFYNEAKDDHPDWFEGQSLDAPPVPADKPVEEDDEEDVELLGESHSPPS
ncbi:hypothetical protein LIER_26831 [Lithospermum erythrorhizon]|uniref:Uncharacterized protein n=1 Tax=Lithospermum erythrorhizon TaxID=34254 RepID=A0AAV3RD17_LITER